MRYSKFAVPAALVACLALSAACSSSDKRGSVGGGSSGEVVIGSVHSLTGPFAATSEALAGGIAVAVDEINAAGGFKVGDKTYKIRLAKADALGTPTGTTTAYTQVIRDEGAKFVFGPDESSDLAAAGQQAVKNDVMWFTEAFGLQTALKTSPNPYGNTAYLVNTGNLNWTASAAKGIREAHPDAKKVSVMFPNAASLDALVGSFSKDFAAQGFQVSSPIRFDATTNDFAALLTRVNAQAPDVLLIGSSSGVIQNVAKQANSLTSVKVIFGSGGGAKTADSSAIGVNPNFAFSYTAVAGVSRAQSDETVQKFYASYSRVNGKEPPAVAEDYAPVYYAPVKALVAAMQKAGTVSDLNKIRDALGTVSAPTLTGDSFSYNQDHTAKVTYLYCEVATDAKVACAPGITGTGS